MVHAAERAEGVLAYTKNSIPDEQRPFHGQSLPLGDTGDGDAGVPSDEQGISNRPGDGADGINVQADVSPDEDEEEDEDEVDVDDEDLDDEEEDDEEGDDRSDPESEPDKPI